MKVVSVVGARPNFVKMAPVIAELVQRGVEHVLVHTGQHYDEAMSAIFFEELGVPPPDYLLGVGSGSHATQTARVMERLEPILAREAPDTVLVPGDVNSTLAAALVAAKQGLKLGHVEAGLRSFDRSMPEEINRIVADTFSEYLFAHEESAISNLRAEGINEGFIYFVGNTMIDTLMAMEGRFRNASVAARIGARRGEYLLVTLHRPALVDGPLLTEALAHLRRVAEQVQVIFPVHPRTRQRLAGEDTGRIQMLDPISYVDFLSLEADACAVLTDSGGVQEETTYLGVRCYTLRDNTERPVTVFQGTNTLLGLAPARISDLPQLMAQSYSPPSGRPALWDGRASCRIAAVLLEAL